jgi:tight adherence protein C
MDFIIPILAAVIFFVGYLAVDKMVVNAQRRKSLRTRLAGDGSVYSEDDQGGAPTSLSDEPSASAKSLLGLLRAMGVNVDAALRSLELKFARAGIVSSDAPIYYLFYKRVVAFILGGIGAFMIITASGEEAMTSQAIGAFIILLAFFGAHLYVENKIAHRTKLLQRAFPDTLDLLLICVESGLGLDAAFGRVCNELSRAYPEMTYELNRTRLELSLLNDRVRALTNLGDRTGMVAFRSLVVALIQSERFGTSLSDTLRVLSEDFRLQRLAHAEAKAARLPVLITLPLMLLLMPAFFIIVLGPAFMGVSKSGALK